MFSISDNPTSLFCIHMNLNGVFGLAKREETVVFGIKFLSVKTAVSKRKKKKKHNSKSQNPSVS